MMVTVSTISLLLLAVGVFGIGFSLGWLFRIDAFAFFKKKSQREVGEPTPSAEN